MGLITDLSFPPGSSVNDEIDPSFCSLSYLSTDTVALAVAELGPGALLAKVDIESAYRLVPVHLQDRLLLGLQWNGEVFCDTRLPFSFDLPPRYLLPLPTVSSGPCGITEPEAFSITLMILLCSAPVTQSSAKTISVRYSRRARSWEFLLLWTSAQVQLPTLFSSALRSIPLQAHSAYQRRSCSICWQPWTAEEIARSAGSASCSLLLAS